MGKGTIRNGAERPRRTPDSPLRRGLSAVAARDRRHRPARTAEASPQKSHDERKDERSRTMGKPFLPLDWMRRDHLMEPPAWSVKISHVRRSHSGWMSNRKGPSIPAGGRAAERRGNTGGETGATCLPPIYARNLSGRSFRTKRVHPEREAAFIGPHARVEDRPPPRAGQGGHHFPKSRISGDSRHERDGAPLPGKETIGTRADGHVRDCGAATSVSAERAWFTTARRPCSARLPGRGPVRAPVPASSAAPARAPGPRTSPAAASA